MTILSRNIWQVSGCQFKICLSGEPYTECILHSSLTGLNTMAKKHKIDLATQVSTWIECQNDRCGCTWYCVLSVSLYVFITVSLNFYLYIQGKPRNSVSDRPLTVTDRLLCIYIYIYIYIYI